MPKEIAKNGKDYSQLSKDDLIKIVEKLESRKKYGLIWDEEKVKEQFEKDAVNALPINQRRLINGCAETRREMNTWNGHAYQQMSLVSIVVRLWSAP